MATVWILEDDNIVAQLIADLLVAYNYTVVRFNGGQLALDALVQGGLPDLMIADIMMLPPDGNDVLEEIKRLGNPPVLVLTALPEALRPELSRVPLAIINKPFTMQELLIMVEGAINRNP